MRTQSTGVWRLTKADALEDAKQLKADIDIRNQGHTAVILPRVRKYGHCYYNGYVQIREV